MSLLLSSQSDLSRHNALSLDDEEAARTTTVLPRAGPLVALETGNDTMIPASGALRTSQAMFGRWSDVPGLFAVPIAFHFCTRTNFTVLSVTFVQKRSVGKYLRVIEIATCVSESAEMTEITIRSAPTLPLPVKHILFFFFLFSSLLFLLIDEGGDGEISSYRFNVYF